MFRAGKLFQALIVILSLTPAVYAADKPAAPKPLEAEIPFARFGGVQDWSADGSRGLFIRGRGMDQWYYATLFGPCPGLPFATAIGFEQDATDVIDRHSTIIVDGKRYPFSSFAMSEPPPSQRKKPSEKD